MTIRTFVPPLDPIGERKELANTFEAGLFVTKGFVLADNTDPDKVAFAWVSAATATYLYFVSDTGRTVFLPAHGLTGDSKGRLWQGVNGLTVDAMPSGSGIAVVLHVATVVDADHLQLFPVTPTLLLG